LDVECGKKIIKEAEGGVVGFQSANSEHLLVNNKAQDREQEDKQRPYFIQQNSIDERKWERKNEKKSKQNV
jgi:hypothetical protein